MRNTLRSSRRNHVEEKNLVNQSIQENISQNIQENTNQTFKKHKKEKT